MLTVLWRGLIEYGRACSCFYGVFNSWRCEHVSFNQSFHSKALADRLWQFTPIAPELTPPFAIADLSRFFFPFMVDLQLFRFEKQQIQEMPNP